MQLGRFKTKALYWISSHTLKCPCFQSVLVRFKHKTVKKHTAWRYVIYTESPDIYCMGIVKRVVWYVYSNCSHNVFSHSFNGFILTYNRDSWVSLHNLRYIYIDECSYIELYTPNWALHIWFQRCRTFFYFVGACPFFNAYLNPIYSTKLVQPLRIYYYQSSAAWW